MGKNYYIQFLRFAFCIAIINYHFYSHYLVNGITHFFCRGYIADEFFFVVSGFYFAKHFIVKKDPDIMFGIKYLLKRIKKIVLPFYLSWLFSFVCIQIVAREISKGNIQDISGQISKLNLSNSIIKDIMNSIYELFFLDMFGFKKGLYCNPVAWYFSAIIISFMILLPFLGRFSNKFSLYFSPLISLFLYAFLSINFDYLYAPHSIISILSFPIYKGLLRAFAGVNIGVFYAALYNNTRIEVFLYKFRYVFIVLVSCIWIGIFAYCIYPFSSNIESVSVQLDYIATFFVAIGLFIILGLDPFVGLNIHMKSTIDKLGNLSIYVFFAQSILYANENYLFSFRFSNTTTFVIFVLLALIFAVVLMLISNLLRKLYRVLLVFLKGRV